MSITRTRRRIAPLAIAALLLAATATGAMAANEADESVAMPAVTLADEDLVVTWPQELAVDHDAALDTPEDTPEAVEVPEESDASAAVAASAAAFDSATAEQVGAETGYILDIPAVIDVSAVDVAATDELQITIAEVAGPGEVVLATDEYMTSSVDPGTPLFAPAGEAADAAWLVTETGEYAVTVEVAVELAGGHEVATESQFAFVVLDDGEVKDPVADEHAPDANDDSLEADSDSSSSGDAGASDVTDDDADNGDAENVDAGHVGAEDIDTEHGYAEDVDVDEAVNADPDQAVDADAGNEQPNNAGELADDAHVDALSLDSGFGGPDVPNFLSAAAPQFSVERQPDVNNRDEIQLASTQSDGHLVLDTGHVDAFEVTIDGNDLVMSLKDDTFLHADEIVYRDPSEVLFQVLPDAATDVPDGSDFAFLGDAGDTVYMLPMTQDPNLLWPGWSTERIRSSEIDGQVELSITALDGPGELKLFTSGTFGGNEVLVDSADGLPDSWGVNVPAHVHANWAFTQTGRYTMTVRADATLADGTSATTGDVTYTWHVGDLDDSGPGGNGGSGGNGGGSGAEGDGSDENGASGDSPGGNGSGDAGDENGSGEGAGPDSGPGGPGGSGDDAGPGGSSAGPGSDGSGQGSNGSGALPHTGASTTALAVVSLLLVAGGVVLLSRTRTTGAGDRNGAGSAARRARRSAISAS